MNNQPDEDSNRADVSLLLDASGVTIYMTRAGLENLAAELIRISKANPKECYEVHLGSHFSRFDANDNYIHPTIKFEDGLGEVIASIGNEKLKESVENGTLDAGWSLSPFEVTIMHVSPQAVRDMGTDPSG